MADDEELVDPKDPDVEARPDRLVLSTEEHDLENVGREETQNQKRRDLHVLAMARDLPATRIPHAEEAEAAKHTEVQEGRCPEQDLGVHRVSVGRDGRRVVPPRGVRRVAQGSERSAHRPPAAIGNSREARR